MDAAATAWRSRTPRAFRGPFRAFPRYPVRDPFPNLPPALPFGAGIAGIEAGDTGMGREFGDSSRPALGAATVTLRRLRGPGPPGGMSPPRVEAPTARPNVAPPVASDEYARPARSHPGERTELDPASAYLAGLGAGSRRTMREALDKLARLASDGRCELHDLPWHLLQLEHTAALRTRLCSTLAPATANKHMAALRGVLKQCWQQGLISAGEYQRVTDLPPIRGEARRPGLALTNDDFERLRRACTDDTGPAGARDEALLALLRESSLRRAEAVALDRDDYDRASRAIVLRAGTHEAVRRVPIAAGTRLALDRWLRIRGDAPGALFNPINKGGRIERRRLSEQAIYIACQKRARAAGLPPTSPEDLRRAATDGRDARPASPRPAVSAP